MTTREIDLEEKLEYVLVHMIQDHIIQEKKYIAHPVERTIAATLVESPIITSVRYT